MIPPRKEPKIRVFLVDDHPFVREGVRTCLLRHEQFEVVGEASSGEETLQKAREVWPDVIVMDITMPAMNGLEVTKALREMCPKAHVLILSVHGKQEFVREALQSGARGYIRKNNSPMELVKAIESINRGEAYFAPELAQDYFNDFVQKGGHADERGLSRLSGRETQVLKFIVEGLANKEIADRLQLSVRTVEKHRQRIMNKLRIHKATELVKYALTQGVINLPEYAGAA